MSGQFRILMAVGLLALSSMACCFNFPGGVVRGSGNIVTAIRDASGFDKVSVSGGIDLVLAQGEEEVVKVEADDNLLPFISTEVHGGELVIKYETDGRMFSIRPTRHVKAYVTMVDIAGIGISGGGDVAADKIETDELAVQISGGGDCRIDAVEAERLDVSISGGGGFATDGVEADVLALDVSGGGDADVDDLRAEALRADFTGGGSLHVAGEVKTQEISMSGGGTYRCEDLASEEAVLKISGGGNAQVWVTEQLDVRLSGGGSVRYYGSPQVDQEVSGRGSVTSAGER